jgi:hypothetical protein
MNVRRTVSSTEPGHSATVTVECSLEFTEFEVNAMNVLGLSYELGCRVLNKDLVHESPVVVFEPHAYPAEPAAGKGVEYPLFAKYRIPLVRGPMRRVDRRASITDRPYCSWIISSPSLAAE